MDIKEWIERNKVKLSNWNESNFQELASWLNYDIFAMDIWLKKYCQKQETLEEWFDRVSGGDKAVKQIIKDKKFLFGGRILSNRGMQKEGQKVTYSNCYVIAPPEDNLESIFDTAKKLARTFSYGGGCGIDISKLAPAGAAINNAAKHTSGAVSFMELYNLTTRLIGQNGRRGALMMSMDIEHPDVLDFIKIKNDLNNLTETNISVKVSDAFMQSLDKDETWTMTYKRDETNHTTVRKRKSRNIFTNLCYNTWDTGEPGILFWDRIKDWNLVSEHPEFEYAGVNPCAEEPLPAGGSCLLGALNLAAFVDCDGSFNNDEFKKAIFVAVKALNDVLDEGLELHPLEEQRKSVRQWRQIGLGIMGLADCLARMHIPYGSINSLDFCDIIGFRLADTAIQASALLAKEQGPYEKFDWKYLTDNKFFQDNTCNDTKVYVKEYGMRNSQLLTIAPTGSISNLIGVNGGIEPLFAYKYTRKTESLHGEDVYYEVKAPILEHFPIVEHIGKIYDEIDGSYVLAPVGDYDMQAIKDILPTAKDINYFDRIEMQGVWQKHIDASISSTINLPESTTPEDIGRAYMRAWEVGCKGVTMFRDNCRRVGVLTTKKETHETPEVKTEKIIPMTRKDLGDRLSGSTYIKHTACGKMYITINHDKYGNLQEVFIDTGKSGGCSANAESLGRLASACMRSNIDINSIVDATKGVRCSACMQVKGSKSKEINGLSCGDILAKTILEEYLRLQDNANEEPIDKKPAFMNKDFSIKLEPVDDKMVCPDCGKPLTPMAGCLYCIECGYSKCD